MKNDCLFLYKSGKFFNVFGDDGIIIHYLFGYKFVVYKNCAGFPESALIKVINTIEDKKIDYQIINKEKDIIKKYSNFNNYNKVLKQALEYRNIKSRVERIQELINNVNDITILERIIGVIENELQ